MMVVAEKEDYVRNSLLGPPTTYNKLQETTTTISIKKGTGSAESLPSV